MPPAAPAEVEPPAPSRSAAPGAETEALARQLQSEVDVARAEARGGARRARAAREAARGCARGGGVGGGARGRRGGCLRRCRGGERIRREEARRRGNRDGRGGGAGASGAAGASSRGIGTNAFTGGGANGAAGITGETEVEHARAELATQTRALEERLRAATAKNEDLSSKISKAVKKGKARGGQEETRG